MRCSYCKIDFDKDAGFPFGNGRFKCRTCNTKHAKKYRENNRQKINQIAYKSMYKNMDKHLARLRVYYQIRNGRMVKKECEKCGNAVTEAHHRDYSKPLDVQWLCRICHASLHKHLSLV